VSLRSVLLALVAVLRFAVSLLGYAVALGFIAIFALQFVHAPKIAQSVLMLKVDRYLNPSIHLVSSWFGWRWPHAGSPSFAPLLLAIAAVFARTILDSIFLRIDFTVRRTLKQAAPQRQRAAASGAQQQYQLSAESEQQRAVLLKRYREIEDALKSSSKKTCSFLSIDVVGSTKMKVGERKTAIDATFQAYEELVKRTFESCGVWKETWTPDGVMACFLDRDLAVSAAQQILSSLARFNDAENQLRTPIAVRCGLNEGDVAIFEDSALEKVADHSIDIAGHMQKYADEDELQISDAFYEKLQKREGFRATGKEVDGFQTYAWKPAVAAPETQTAPTV
jgi:class 3 adenylate cyclase